MRHSFLASIYLLVAQALEDQGCDSSELFRSAGLDPERLNDPNARYPIAAGSRLLELAVEKTRDPYFNLRIANYWHPTTLHALGYSWMASDSLKEALERLVLYHRLINDLDYLALQRQDRHFVLTLSPDKLVGSALHYDIDMSNSIVNHMCRILLGENFRFAQLTVPALHPTPGSILESHFGTTVHYSGEVTRIFFSEADVLGKSPAANAVLARANDQVITDYLASFDQDQIATRAQSEIIRQLASGSVNRDDIAAKLHMSPKTLQRRLVEEGTNFRQLLDETREHLARQYVKDSRLLLAEVTYLLGFSDTANFNRAFRRWTGMTPTRFRKH